jgi:hypothetical protein
LQLSRKEALVKRLFSAERHVRTMTHVEYSVLAP